MSKFIAPEIIVSSFRRLRPKATSGKTHLERSSALLYFLAVDATAKSLGAEVLDVNPDVDSGRTQRRDLQLEFAKLVQLAPYQGIFRQVQALGWVTLGGNEPEKRLSSNFLTVPVKKAASQTADVLYPNRPSSAPLLKLGKASTGSKWGIQVYENWSKSFPKYFEQVPTSTFSFDLAIFLSRHEKIDDTVSDLTSAVKGCLRNQFSCLVSDPWIARIQKERIYAKDLDRPAFEVDYRPWEELLTPTDVEPESRDELAGRIVYLEGLLQKHNIPFE